MVSLIRSWNYDHNYSIVGGTLLAQYQDYLFRIKQWFLAAGWTITRSCDSANAGAAGDGIDRWVTSANIIAAASGVAHSWIIFQSPVAPRIFFLIDCVDASAATPDAAVSAQHSSDFTTGGTTTARPTATGEMSIATHQILSSTSVVPRTFHGWRDDQGTIAITGITNGQGSPYDGILITRLANGESNIERPWWVSWTSSTTNPGGAFLSTSAGLFSTTVGRTWAVGGVSNNSPRLISCATEATLWVSGASNANVNLADFPIDLMQNSATLGGYSGRFIDIRATAQLTASGVSQAPQDPDAVVRKAVGNLWLPVPTGTILQF